MMDIRGGQFVVDGWHLSDPHPGTGFMPSDQEGKLEAMIRRMELSIRWTGGRHPRMTTLAEGGVGQLRTLFQFLAVKVPETSAEHLAASVLMGEPCGRELVDCLIETGVVDPASEALRHARLETLDAVRQVLNKLRHDTEHGDYPDADDRILMDHVIAAVNDLT